MGLPFPPPWLECNECGTCAAAIFSDRTPCYIYAHTQGITRCPIPPHAIPVPNRVVRMEQQPGEPCKWQGTWEIDIFVFEFTLRLDFADSQFTVHGRSGIDAFFSLSPLTCKTSFSNQLVCSPLPFPSFSGGTVNCFW